MNWRPIECMNLLHNQTDRNQVDTSHIIEQSVFYLAAKNSSTTPLCVQNLNQRRFSAMGSNPIYPLISALEQYT